jgi:inosine/xanthosine triphosphate pyrophosphatase family protein
MEDKADRTAQFITVLAYFDGEKDHYFYDIEEGYITEQIRTGDIRGWTDILYIYGYKTFPNKALCELNDNEWESYLADIEKNDFISQFKRHLESSF